jgi:hypothetical protein
VSWDDARAMQRVWPQFFIQLGTQSAHDRLRATAHLLPGTGSALVDLAGPGAAVTLRGNLAPRSAVYLDNTGGVQRVWPPLLIQPELSHLAYLASSR